MEILMINMMLLIATINFAQLVLKKLFGYKIDNSILSCGITAYCGNHPADPNVIKMIMMFNMERGEDGTGWAANNLIEKDTEKVSKFVVNHSLDISENDENFTVIAHARKSSSGTKTNKELVHPFGVYKDGVEKEKFDLILAMNGTLLNTELVAETFSIEYKQWINSDTQVMAKAMANLGEKEYIKVIQGYVGTATLVFFSPKYPNTLMVYKDPERPLYYWQKEKDEMYISSMEEPLFSLGANKLDVRSFIGEHLYKITKGKITKDELITRNPIRPKAVYKSNGSVSSHYPRRDQYEGDVWTSNAEWAKSPLMSTSKDNIRNLELYDKKVNKKNAHVGKGNLVYTITDRYYRNGHAIHGIFFIGVDGTVLDWPTEQNPTVEVGAKKYFFINGYMCTNETQYNALSKRSSNEKGIFDLSKFKFILLSEVIDYLQYPVITIVDKKEKWIITKEYNNKIFKKGDTVEVNMFLSTDIFILKYEGEWTKTTKKEVCNLVSVIQKQVKVDKVETSFNIVELEKKTSRKKQLEYLEEEILKDDKPIIKSNYHYVMMRNNIFKVNPNNESREYYYNLLFELLNTHKILSKASIFDLKVHGEKNEYGSTEFINEVDIALLLLKNKLKQDISSAEISSIDEKLTTSQKIKLLDGNKEIFTAADVIESIKKNNAFFMQESFKNDVSDGDYDSFDEFVRTWVNTDIDADLLPLLEAILLCYNIVNHTTDSELLDILDGNAQTIRRRVEKIYEQWKKQFEDTSKILIDQVNKMANNEEEPVEDVVVEETFTTAQYELTCKQNYQELVDSLKQYVNEIDTLVEPELKSEWVTTSANIVTDMIKFMERKQFINDLKQENEHR